MSGYRDNENRAAFDAAKATTRVRFGFARRLIARWRLFEMKTWKKWLFLAIASGVAGWVLINVACCTHGIVSANFWAASIIALILTVVFGIYAGGKHPE